jgi:hypothetical protein
MSVYPGNLLTVTAASVNASPASTRTWEWLRNGVAIPASTTTTYRVTEEDIGSALAALQKETNFLGFTSATSLPVGPVQAFSPSALFESGEQGAWFDPSDVANLDWRVNRLTWSQDFRSTSEAGSTRPWTISVGANSISVDYATAPDGTDTANRMTFTASDYPGRVQGQQVVFGTTYTFSVYIRRVSGANAGRIEIAGPGIISGTTVFNATTSWTRVSVTATATASGTASVFIYPEYAPAATGEYLIWGAQAQVGSVATTYQPITTVEAGTLSRFPNATLYQDVAGTILVTAPSQPVGLMLDKSRGLAQGPEQITNGNFDSGPTGWYSLGSGAALPGSFVVDGALRIGTSTEQNPATTISTVPVGGTVVVTFRARLVSGSVSALVRFSNAFGANLVTAASFGTLTPTWADYRLVFTNTSSTRGVFSFREDAGTGGLYEVDSVSVKELAGNHATQGTPANRPVYAIEPFGGRRNLGLMTSMTSVTGTAGSQFPNATGWANFFNTGGTRTYVASSQFPGDQALDISGVTAARNLIGYSFTPLASTTYTVSFWIESFSGVTGTISYVSGTLGTGGTTNIVAAPLSTGRASYTFTTGTSPGTVDIRLGIGTAGNESGSIRISGFQVELGSTATAYQRVTDQYNVTEAGIPSVSYLSFNGMNYSMSTSSINFPAGPTNPTLGPELVTNGDFSQGSTGWTLNAGWSVVSSTLVSTAAAAGTSAFQALVGLKPNTTYRVNFDVSGYSAGFVYAQFFAGGESSPWQSGNGPKSVFITTPSSVANNNFGLTAVFSAFTGTIDNVSVREIDAAQVPNKMTVFAGVRKNSDAAVGVVTELIVARASNAGSFTMFAPSSIGSPNYYFTSRGTVDPVTAAIATTYTAPISNVVSGIGDISGDFRATRVNAVAVTNTEDQGTGTYGNYPLFIGARNNADLRFNGNLYSLIVRGAQSSSGQITGAEAWVQQKTPLPWLLSMGYWQDASAWNDNSTWNDGV